MIQEYSQNIFFRILSAVIFGAMAVGQNSSFAPDYAEGKVSAKRMFKLFDSKTKIDAYDNTGHRPVSIFDRWQLFLSTWWSCVMVCIIAQVQRSNRFPICTIQLPNTTWFCRSSWSWLFCIACKNFSPCGPVRMWQVYMHSAHWKILWSWCRGSRKYGETLKIRLPAICVLFSS